MQSISTTTPILANATYTSKWVLSNTADTITGSIFADKSGTVYIEQSSDGVNADVSTNYPYTGGTGAGIEEDILCPFIRLRFTDTSGTDQTSFRLFIRMASGGVKA